MFELSSLLRQVADTLDSINNRVHEQRMDEEAPMFDKESIKDAVVTLSASAISAVLDVADSLPRPPHMMRHSDAGDTQSGDVAEEVDKAIGRLGLVQEEELAALRKRVIDLEAKLSN